MAHRGDTFSIGNEEMTADGWSFYLLSRGDLVLPGSLTAVAGVTLWCSNWHEEMSKKEAVRQADTSEMKDEATAVLGHVVK